MRSGAAGTIRLSTLNVNDIIKPGKKWGIELKTETANNSIKAQLYAGVPIGQDYRITAPDGRATLAEWAVFFKDDDRIEVRKSGRNKPLKDNAVRLALAAQDDHYEVLGAYAYRTKGNYFSGKRGGKKYGEGMNLKQIEAFQQQDSDDPYVPLIALIYRPGEEVPNTSYESKSWLLKGKLKFNNHTNLSANFRDTKINYGDIMPSRLGANLVSNNVLQWPLADVKQKTGSVEFAYNPPDNKWLDLKIGAWAVKNNTATNTSGGSPGDVLFSDGNLTLLYFESKNDIYNEFGENALSGDLDPAYDEKITNRMEELYYPRVKEYMKNPRFKNVDGIFNTQPAQVQYARDKHMGLTFSNVMEITPKLRLSLMSNYRRETLDSTNVYEF